jgi:hypothetical protein
MQAATIHVRFSEPGFHNWQGAPEHRSYLGDRHRHLFAVQVSTEVSHDDREIEFHDLLDEARAIFKSLQDASGGLGGRSCEMIGREIGVTLALRHDRPFTVSVWEDNEVGATVVTG